MENNFLPLRTCGIGSFGDITRDCYRGMYVLGRGLWRIIGGNSRGGTRVDSSPYPKWYPKETHNLYIRTIVSKKGLEIMQEKKPQNVHSKKKDKRT